MFPEKPKPASAWLPLALIWLAVHAVLLGAILGLKFLTAKTLLLLAMAGATVWLVLGRRRPLPRLRDVI